MTNGTEASATLFEAMQRARHVEKVGTDKRFALNFSDAIRHFKNAWIYTSAKSLRLDTRLASGSYLFVFSKNLHVTNVALPELLSLTRTFTKRRTDQSALKLNFFSNEEYTRYLTNSLAALFPSGRIATEAEYESVIRQISDVLAHQHSSVICDTIILDAYFTTALMHIPLSLETNIQSIVFESGYIHSAGHSLYIRRAEKAKPSELEERLRLFLENSGAKPPIFVTPYADEYFAPWEKQSSATSTRNGLDGIRLELRKHFIQGQPLRDYLNVLDQDFSELHVAPGLKHYKTERQESGANPDWTIWLIADTRHVQTEEMITTRAKDPYLMVYAQKYHNANQFVLFKERKLAWTAPITLPHTLSTGMVNIARSGLAHGDGQRPVIIDPFCGTGTTLIDAVLRIPDAVVLGLDRNPLMPRLVADNLEFFAKDKSGIERLNELFSVLSRRIAQVHGGTPNSNVRPIHNLLTESKSFDLNSLVSSRSEEGVEFETILKACLAELRLATQNQATQLIHGSEKIIDDGFSKEMTSLLAGCGMTWLARTLFFATWRGIASARHSVRADLDMYPVLQREYETIAKELNDYLESLRQAESVSVGNFSGRRGTYSLASITDPAKIANIAHKELLPKQLPGDLQSLQSGSIHTLVVSDSTQVLAGLRSQVDLVITDPPYGFNTHEFEILELQNLYTNFVRAAVSALRPRGQLIVVVPSFARNGKQVPYFQTGGALIRQIIGSANALDREVLNVVHTVPTRKMMYLPPFYWFSPSALSRKILWFTIE